MKLTLLALLVTCLSAQAGAQESSPGFDVVFVLDTSDSTFAPSGADIDGDGTIGKLRRRKFTLLPPRPLQYNTDDGDSILAAELVGVRSFVRRLDATTTRVGLVAFGGDREGKEPPARTVVPLTSNLAVLHEGLDALKARGPLGRTHMEAAVDLGAIELLGTKRAQSTRRERARRVMLFLTDGQPTIPFENAPAENAALAIGAADQAGGFGVRIDTFGIGERALADPGVLVEMARVTGGSFTPVPDARELGASLEKVSWFADAAVRP